MNRSASWRGRAAATCAILALVAAAALAAPAANDAKKGPAAAVDLNAATADELVAVPGIGPALANRIVEFRDQNGPFRRIEDLLKVRGIGEKSLEKLRPYLKVAAPKS